MNKPNLDRPHRLAHLNEVVARSKQLHCPVADVWFGPTFDMLVIMRHAMPDPIRQRFGRDPVFDYAVVDYDANFPGWTSYHEVLMDRESRVAIIYPRPPELLEQHKADLRARAG